MERAFGFKKWSFFLKPFLLLLSGLYLLGGSIRKFLTKKFFPKNIKVISVGSPFAGGTGKTIFAIFLTWELIKMKKEVFYLQKAYSFLGFNNHDEYYEAVESLGEERVIRTKSVKKFLMEEDKKGIEKIFVIDDGFTNPGIHKDLNIVVFDSDVLFGNKKILPLGPMRVSLKKLKDAHLIVLKGQKKIQFEGIKSINMELIPQSFIELKTGKRYPPDFFKGKKAVILCGTGNPFSFLNTIRSVGIHPQNILIFPDHYRYSEKELKTILENETVITTIKDSKRLPPLPNFFALKVKPFIKKEDMEILMTLISTIIGK